VPEQSSPRIGRRRLAAELRRLRELANLTGEEVAEQLGWSGSKISRIELNRTEVKSADLAELLDLYGVRGTHRANLIALARVRRSRGWWTAYGDLIAPEYSAYIELEAEADSALCWSSYLVHGLLQTEDYAQAVIETQAGWSPTTPPGHLRRLVDVRVARQRVLTGNFALTLSVIIDEAVLLRQIGSAAVMRDQLAHLVAAAQQPNMTIQVLPLSGAHPVGAGSFSLLVFPPFLGVGLQSDVLYIEHLVHDKLLADEESEVYEYRLAYDQLAAEALDPDASRDLIAEVARETWS
jgi:transcriptional regulator with XRE-family HTH domain